MMPGLTPEQRAEIAEKLDESAAGYSGFLSWARGEVEELGAPSEADLAWRATLMVFAGKGRVEVLREILEDHPDPISQPTEELIRATDTELDEWLSGEWNRVSEELEEALPLLLTAYRRAYTPGKQATIGWNFDDFLDERDLLEFLLIGLGDLFPVTEFREGLVAADREVREWIEALRLETLEEEFFPGRIEWLPRRFWWHHPRE